MGLGDALGDRQAEADTGVVRAYAAEAAKKRLAKGGNQLWVEPLAKVIEHWSVRDDLGQALQLGLIGG